VLINNTVAKRVLMSDELIEGLTLRESWLRAPRIETVGDPTDVTRASDLPWIIYDTNAPSPLDISPDDDVLVHIDDLETSDQPTNASLSKTEPEMTEPPPSDPWGIKKLIPPTPVDEPPPEAEHASKPAVNDVPFEPEIPAGPLLEDRPEPMGQPIMRLPRIKIDDDEEQADSPEREPAEKAPPAAPLKAAAKQVDEDELPTVGLDTILPVLHESQHVDVDDSQAHVEAEIEVVTGEVVAVPEEEPGQPDIIAEGGEETATSLLPFEDELEAQPLEFDATPASEDNRTHELLPSSFPTRAFRRVETDSKTTKKSRFRLMDYWFSLLLTAVIVAGGVSVITLRNLSRLDSGPIEGSIGGAGSQEDVLNGPVGGPVAEDALPPTTLPDSASSQPTSAPDVAPAYRSGKVAFASNRSGDFDLYTLDMVTGAVDYLFGYEGSDERYPAWSADGSRVVFVSNKAGSNDLYVVGSDGGHAVQLTTSDASDLTPAWAPDGSRIAFSRENVDGSSIMTVGAGCINDNPGSCESQLNTAAGDSFNTYPAWSPEGLLTFTTALFVGRPSKIAVLNTASSAYSELTGTTVSDFSPAWSADGSKIVFVSFASGQLGDNDIWLMDAGGSNAVRLTTMTTDDVQPVYAPYGSWITFASDRGTDNNFELYVLDTVCAEIPDSCEGDIIQVTENLADDLDPAWTSAP